MRKLVGLLAALGAWGCDDGGKDSGGEPDTATDPLIACAELDADACSSREDCAPIDADALQHEGDGACIDPDGEALVGCRDAGTPCDESIETAAPPDDPDSCWIFSNGCLPEGWVPCDASWGEDPQQALTCSACANLDVDTCAGREDCAAIDAWPVEEQDGQPCVDYAAREPVGCMDAEVGCDDIVVSGSPPDDPGACWLFSSDCMPEGWVPCEAWDTAPWDYPECPGE